MLDIRLSFHENLSYVNGDNVSQVSVFVPYSICASKIQSEIRRFKFCTDPENNEFLKDIVLVSFSKLSIKNLTSLVYEILTT